MIHELLSLIRFPLMDSAYLSDVIKIHPLMQPVEQVNLVLEAFEHHALVACGRNGIVSQRTKRRKQSCSFSNYTNLIGHNDAVSTVLYVGEFIISGKLRFRSILVNKCKFQY